MKYEWSKEDAKRLKRMEAQCVLIGTLVDLFAAMNVKVKKIEDKTNKIFEKLGKDETD